MSSKTSEESIQDSFKNLFENKSYDDEREHRKHMIMFRCLAQVEKLMEDEKITKRDLATLINTSASYITQVFNGNKVINLDFLARVEIAFDKKFFFDLSDENSSNVNFQFDEIELLNRLNQLNKNQGCWTIFKKDDGDVYNTNTPIEWEGETKVLKRKIV